MASKRAVSICWALTCCGVLAAEPLEVPLATGEWPPYVSQKMPGRGIFTQLVEESFKRAGLKPVYHFTSWPRAEAMVEQGLVFAAFPYALNEERPKRFDYSAPVLMSRSVLFYYRSEQAPPRFEKLSDFAGMQIASPRGYWYEDILRRYGAQISYTSDEQSAFRLLSLGRAEGVVQDELVGWYLIAEYFPELQSRFANATMPIGERNQSLHLLVSRRYPDAAALRSRLDPVINAVRDSGMAEKLINKFRPGSAYSRDDASPGQEVAPKRSQY